MHDLTGMLMLSEVVKSFSTLIRDVRRGRRDVEFSQVQRISLRRCPSVHQSVSHRHVDAVSLCIAHGPRPRMRPFQRDNVEPSNRCLCVRAITAYNVMRCTVVGVCTMREQRMNEVETRLALLHEDVDVDWGRGCVKGVLGMKSGDRAVWTMLTGTGNDH